VVKEEQREWRNGVQCLSNRSFCKGEEEREFEMTLGNIVLFPRSAISQHFKEDCFTLEKL
jgi:hypothetical protein